MDVKIKKLISLLIFRDISIFFLSLVLQRDTWRRLRLLTRLNWLVMILFKQLSIEKIPKKLWASDKE